MSDEVIDPQHSTAAAISRRGFAIATTAAVAGLANPVLAQTEQFGKPHSPIVPEDDPDIIILRTQLQPAAGGPIQAYAAHPAIHCCGGPKSSTVEPVATPGVVVIQAIWGVDAQLRDVVRRFAKAGYIAIAPALYSRLDPPSGDGISDIAEFRPLARQMSEQGFVQTDIAAARDWITTISRKTKVGITGFCMGGGVVLKEVVSSGIFAAAAPFYGAVKPVFDEASAIKTPLLGSYGARDTSILPQDVTAFFSRVPAPHDVRIYDEAGHAFFDDTRQSYVASAASDAWRRTLAWFQTYLGN